MNLQREAQRLRRQLIGQHRNLAKLRAPADELEALRGVLLRAIARLEQMADEERVEREEPAERGGSV